VFAVSSSDHGARRRHIKCRAFFPRFALASIALGTSLAAFSRTNRSARLFARAPMGEANADAKCSEK
jgi:hypothetical protein